MSARRTSSGGFIWDLLYNFPQQSPTGTTITFMLTKQRGEANNFTSLDVVRETSNATPALAAGSVSVSSEFVLATYRR